MNRLMYGLLRWVLGDEDARILASELKEQYGEKLEAEGGAKAGLWLRREILRAVVLGIGERMRGPDRSEDIPTSRGAAFGEAFRSVFRDVRFGLRTLRKRRLFTTIAVATMGLGIGASTIVFSLVDGVLLEDMPYERPGELVNIWVTYPGWRDHEVTGEAWDKIGLNWEGYRNLRDNSQVLSELGVHRFRRMVLTGVDRPERLQVGEASPGLFPVLGVRPLLGRVFLPGEEGPGTAPMVVLSNSLWRTRFGSDPEIVGSTIELNREPFEVIGVLPPDVRIRSTIFNLLNSAMDSGERALWVPLQFDRVGIDGSQDHEAVGRLVPGATVEQLRAELDVLIREGRAHDEVGFRLTRPKDEIVAGHRSALRMLLAAAGILLVIACANIAALLSSEAAGRRHEMATRVALGAGRFRITRQVLTESLLLGLMGSFLGIGLAAVGIPGLLSLAPPLPRLEEVGMSRGVLFFAIVAGVGAGCAFGLVPAGLLRHDSLRTVQATGGRTSSGGRWRFQRGLIGAELALTVVLLVSGGLLVRSLLNLTRVDPGFDASSVATVRAHIPRSASEQAAGRGERLRHILARIEAIPGVDATSAVDLLPFPGRVTGNTVEIEGREGNEFIIRNHAVLPGYLETMGIPLLAGRSIDESDARDGATPIALVNERMARQYWPNESPLGARVRLDRTFYEVVGIVGDVRERHLSEAPKAMLWRVRSSLPSAMSIVARTQGSPAALIPQMRQAIWAVDPNISLSQQSTMPDLVEASTGAERYRTMLLSVFGVLATLLAAVGVFGVTAHSVSKRTRDMGIRLALGARSGRLIRGVVSEVMLPGVVGIGLGVAGALAVSRLLTAYLFGVEAWDTATLGSVVLLLAAICVGAALFPAMRVGRVNPVTVLREE